MYKGILLKENMLRISMYKVFNEKRTRETYLNMYQVFYGRRT